MARDPKLNNAEYLRGEGSIAGFNGVSYDYDRDRDGLIELL